MNLATEYAWATEVNLATLGELCSLKSSSQSRIQRQENICARMLQVCQEYAPEIDDNPWPHDITRVREVLLGARNYTQDGIAKAVRAWSVCAKEGKVYRP